MSLKKVMTLCIVHRDDRVLLGMKKRGFGQGRWSRFGGKVMPGELIEDAARRELYEEAGVSVGPLETAGNLRFSFLGNPELLEMHVFRADRVDGEPVETEEMRPQWFVVEDIPFGDMWLDDAYWMPYFLAGKKFCGTFTFNDAHALTDHELLEV